MRTVLCEKLKLGHISRTIFCRGAFKHSQVGLKIPSLVWSEV